jgi:fumarate reductase subunit C
MRFLTNPAVGVFAWLTLAALLFAAFVWFNLGLVFGGPNSVDAAFSAALLGGSVVCVVMAGTWRRG